MTFSALDFSFVFFRDAVNLTYARLLFPQPRLRALPPPPISLLFLFFFPFESGSPGFSSPFFSPRRSPYALSCSERNPFFLEYTPPFVYFSSPPFSNCLFHSLISLVLGTRSLLPTQRYVCAAAVRRGKSPRASSTNVSASSVVFFFSLYFFFHNPLLTGLPLHELII